MQEEDGEVTVGNAEGDEDKLSGHVLGHRRLDQGVSNYISFSLFRRSIRNEFTHTHYFSSVSRIYACEVQSLDEVRA